ncbi:MAG: hypothetical protein IBJ17_01720 [Reyranella sp.]|nr:hypothetical protein [Reyranella sp.]
MKNTRVATSTPRRWRGGREVGGRRVWMPVTDAWVGTSDARLWNRWADDVSSSSESWLDQLRWR